MPDGNGTEVSSFLACNVLECLFPLLLMFDLEPRSSCSDLILAKRVHFAEKGHILKVYISRNLGILLALLVMITSCGTGTGEFREAVIAASISPVSAALLTGAAQQFTATVTGSSNTAVTWSATGGTVSTSGLYTAPATAGTYSVTATSQADTTKSASATVTVTTPPVVAVSISPVSAALLTGGTQQFTATVTGSSNTAVTWLTTGGTVSTNGLYTAPATAGTYSVTATSQADPTVSATASVTVTSSSDDSPTLVQHVSCPNSSAPSGGGSPQSSTPDYLCPLPEPSQSGNAILVGVTSYNGGAPYTVSDDQSNAYTTVNSVVDSNSAFVAIYVATNVAAGTRFIKLHGSNSQASNAAVTVSEYYNVATSSAVDSSSCTADSSGTTITAGSITPTVSGDLLWQVAFNASGGGSTPGAVSSFTAGSQSNITWQFLGADLFNGSAEQAGVYSSTSAINPTFTSGTSQTFTSCAMALKAASAGNAPTSAFRIVHMLHQQIGTGSANPWPMLFPTSGNLIVLSLVSGGSSISSISSSPSNTWTSTGTFAGGTSGVAGSQMYYAANATPSTSMTISVTHTASTNDTYMMYDIVGAATLPFDKDSGGETGDQTSEVTSLTTCSGCLTPSGNTGGNEIILANAGWQFCTGEGSSSPSGSLFDAAYYTGTSVNGPQSVDQNNGWLHYYDSSTSAVTVDWTLVCDQDEGNWAGRVAAFKSSQIGPAAPTGLTAVVH